MWNWLRSGLTLISTLLYIISCGKEVFSEKNPYLSYRVPASAVIRQSNETIEITNKNLRNNKLGASKLGKDDLSQDRSSKISVLANVSLNERILKIQRIVPLLFFVNRKSGGRLGKSLLNSLRSTLSDVQVCDLTVSSPSEYLKLFQKCKRLRIVCCGGDGTVSWLMRDLHALNMSHVPIGLVPLGTGNDLYKVLSLLGNSPSLLTAPNVADARPFFSQFIGTQETYLDRWSINLKPTAVPKKKKYKLDENRHQFVKKIKNVRARLAKVIKKQIVPERTMNNYFGIGVDGHVSLTFDSIRKQFPTLFFSQLMNKLWYMFVGIWEFILRSQSDLSQVVELVCDGVPVPIPNGTCGLIVLNINSYAGGSRLWNFEADSNGNIPRFF